MHLANDRRERQPTGTAAAERTACLRWRVSKRGRSAGAGRMSKQGCSKAVAMGSGPEHGAVIVEDSALSIPPPGSDRRRRFLRALAVLLVNAALKDRELSRRGELKGMK